MSCAGNGPGEHNLEQHPPVQANSETEAPSEPSSSQERPASGEPPDTVAPAQSQPDAADRPAGEQFALERWQELTELNPPWWARSPGLGLRLRLFELGEVAAVSQAGGVSPQAVTKLIDDTSKFLTDRAGYCARAYPEISSEVRSLREAALGRAPFFPEGAGASAIMAARTHLERTDYVRQLARDLAVEAAASGRDAGKLRLVEKLVELLDAELIYDGHSRAWRHDLVLGIRREWEASHNLGNAIASELGKGRYGERRKFDIVVPLSVFVAPTVGGHGFDLIDADAAVHRITDWNVAGVPEVLATDEFTRAATFAHFTAEAPDAAAAAEVVNTLVTKTADLLRLRGGSLVPFESAFVFDPAAGLAEIRPLPPEPLDLWPTSANQYLARGSNLDTPSPLDNALAQLAQAQGATPLTAIVNLWTAAEVLFGGVIGEPSSEAGEVMANLGELLYIRDLLTWLAEAYIRAGLGPVPAAVGKPFWALEITSRPKDVLKALESIEVLAWYRAKLVLAWDKGSQFHEQLEELRSRLLAAAERAYLVRNFVVHRANVGSKSIAVTLPVFAALVRECTNHIAMSASERPLAEAKFQVMEVERVAKLLADKRSEARSAIPALLLGAVNAVESAIEATGPQEVDE